MATTTTEQTRRGGRTVAAVGWLMVGVLGFLLLTQTFGGGTASTWIVVLQALSPYLFPWALPVLVGAVLTRRRALASCSAIALVGAGVLVVPLLRPVDVPVVDAAAPRVSVLHANVYKENEEPVAAADALLDAGADVLVLSEVQSDVAEALDAIGAAERYPYRAGEVTEGADSIVIWSRLPMSDSSVQRIEGRTAVTAYVLAGGRELRVLAVHPEAPFSESGRASWVDALEAVNAEARAGDVPTLLVGDMNAGWWHPPYRRSLSDGLLDVHRALGEAFSVSWPTDRRIVPPFTRLDHAFVDDRVQPLDIDDVVVPGSDHEGFLVSVAVGLR